MGNIPSPKVNKKKMSKARSAEVRLSQAVRGTN